jgi:hypothetical protein
MLSADATTIRLGRLGREDAATTGSRHLLLFVPGQQMVVMPFARVAAGWDCVIVGSRAPRQAHHLTLTDEHVAAASPTIPVDAERDPDGYARLVWMSQAFRCWPGGAMLAFAGHIVDQLRIPCSVQVAAPALADHNRIAARLPNTRPLPWAGSPISSSPPDCSLAQATPCGT